VFGLTIRIERLIRKISRTRAGSIPATPHIEIVRAGITKSKIGTINLSIFL